VNNTGFWNSYRRTTESLLFCGVDKRTDRLLILVYFY